MNDSPPLHNDEKTVLIAKVERLFRKARSSQFPEEAKAYEEKALYLMARARITEAMLDLDQTSDEIVDIKIGSELNGGYNAPAEMLFAIICRAYSCRPYYATYGRRSQPSAVGFDSDLQRVALVWPILLADAFRASAQLKGRNAAQTKDMRRSALFGYVDAINERFERINRIATGDAERCADQSASDDKLDESNQAGPAAAALVFKSREEQVDSVFQQKQFTARRGAVSAGRGGRDHGYAAGMQADLSGGGRGVSGGSKQLSA